MFSTAPERTLTLRPEAIDISDARRWRPVLALVLIVLLFGLAGRRAAAAEGAKPAAGEGAIQGPTYVRLPPIVLPVFEGNRITRRAGAAAAATTTTATTTAAAAAAVSLRSEERRVGKECRP